jgi:lipoate-protein ligase A
VIGSAQLRRGSALLQHGSILLHDDQRMVTGLMSGSAQGGPPGPELSLGIPAKELANQIADAAEMQWNGEWKRMQRDPGPIMKAATLHYPQFQSLSWTWAR